MERILTAQQMRLADEYTITKLGIPEEVLVERAGVAVAEEIQKRFKGGRILIAVGKGNNGKDGRIVAEILSSVHGFAVTLYDVFNDDISVLDGDYDIILDCIFGTGLNRDVTGKAQEVIEKINAKNCFVIACDIPSGLNADTGFAMNVCVKADLTIAVQEYKTGHFFNDGKDLSGHVKAKDIGISIWEEDFAFRLRHKDVAKYFPKRKENTNKGSYKKVGVIGGSKEFFGSVMLSNNALAGLCGGAGYSYLIVPESLYSTYAGVNPECIIKTLKDDGNNFIADDSVIEKIKNLNAVAFGMGVGVTEGVYKLLSSILKNYTGKLLIDADGLNALAKFGTDILNDKKCEVLLTPHVKEFSRLTGDTVQDILLDPIGKTKALAQKYGVTVALKSATSIITDGKNVCINVTGSPALAKAGSGDVLSGIDTALMAEHGVFEGACVGAYIFGKAGEFCAKEYGEYSVTASMVTDAIGKVIAVL